MEKKTFENVYLKCRHKSTIPPNWPAILLRIEWRKKRKEKSLKKRFRCAQADESRVTRLQQRGETRGGLI